MPTGIGKSMEISNSTSKSTRPLFTWAGSLIVIFVYVEGWNIIVFEDWNINLYVEGRNITVIKDGNVIMIEG